tara:strand:+ start:324 stop:632 length:309 start_codon:yes stop_codon:yes gene_type:complete
MPSLGHNETLLYRESETPVCVFNRGAWLFLTDNELTSVPSPSNTEPLKSQYLSGEIGNSERTEVSTEGALQGCFGIKQQTQRLKKLIWNFLHSSALKKYDNQ